MEHEAPRQGRIAGWLKMNQSSIVSLAAHCGKSKGTMSRHCNAAEVPTDVLAAMKSFVAATGKTIPIKYLPVGKDKKRGPKKGWLDQRYGAVAQATGTAGTI
ncbi:MAG: hypothetical protein ACNI27_13000 [Desulfovibrio sp.]